MARSRSAHSARSRSRSAASVEIPVTYDGPDLDEVAQLTGLSPREVVARHTGAEHVAAFLGFQPGFAYLTGGDELLHVPRRDVPRTVVPGGTVAIAGPYSGVYPRDSPGGWRLLGSTTAVAVRPAARAAGAARAGRPRQVRRGMTCVEVVSPGLLTTVQDRGRPGLAHLGVPPSGAADPVAYELGNRLVGNPPGAAALEATLDGPVLRFDVPTTIALTGATSPGSSYRRSARSRTVRGRCAHVRRVRGGIDVEPTLGSRSTDLLTGLGPAPLRTGDRLRIGLEPAEAQPTPPGTVPGFGLPDEPVLRVRLGPRDDWFTAAALDALCSEPWRVSSSSNRVGIRLEGPPLERARHDELLSEGLVTGALQVPASGQPILLLQDHPTTGGYPVIARRLFGRPVDCRPARTEAIRAVRGRRLASWRGCARSARPGARAHRRFASPSAGTASPGWTGSSCSCAAGCPATPFALV